MCARRRERRVLEQEDAAMPAVATTTSVCPAIAGLAIVRRPIVRNQG
jgi:hypothetical protein